MFRSLYHILFTVLFCGVIIAVVIHRTNHYLWQDLITIFLTLLCGNLIEYALHRWPMHRKWLGSQKFFLFHMLHHQRFQKESYEIKKFEDFSHIVFGPPVLILMNLLIVAPIGYLLARVFEEKTALIFAATLSVYYVLMQIMHIIAHISEAHWLMRIPGLLNMRGHHLLHHDPRHMSHYNFNFIIPLYDQLLDTNSSGKNAIP